MPVGKEAVFLRVLGVLRVELLDLLGVWEGPGAEGERVNHAEDARVHPDAKGQHGDGSEGKPGGLGEEAEGEFQVLE
jgi:hypothetical protein